jgi:hypothetical protein
MHQTQSATREAVAERPRGWLHWLAASVAYLVLALVLTWPLPQQLFSHIPLGKLEDATVPFFNLWTLEWNASRLAHGYTGYWDAPLFYPARDAFALSEPQGLTGLVFAPLQRCFGSLAGYNLTLYFLLICNGLSARRLARAMGASQYAASLLGALALAMPFVQSELGVLQLTAAFPVFLGLAELRHLSASDDVRALLRLALWTLALVWSCVYYALFFGLTVLVAGVLLFRRSWLQARMLGAGALALAVVALGSYPLVTAQHRALAQHARSERAIRSGSGSWLAYLHFPRDTPVAQLWPGWTRPAHRRSLYPGAIVVGLAVLGGARARRSQPRSWLRAAVVAAGLSLFLSFGTRLHIGDVRPYAFTAERYFPGFEQLRSPYRAALLVHVWLLAFAGLGLDALGAWAASRTRLARWLPGLCVAAALLEVWPGALATRRFPYEHLFEAWIPWLRAQPSGAVAMIPPVQGQHAADYEDTVVGMLQALRHGHPIVNGYSGFFPPRADRIAKELLRFPLPAVLQLLREDGVRYAVVDRRWSGTRRFDAPGLRLVFEDARRRVYQLTP